MIFLRYFRNMTIGVLSLVAMSTFGGCSDENFSRFNGDPGTLVINLSDKGTRAALTSPTTEAERNITDLRYFAFPVANADASQMGEFKSGKLDNPTATEMLNGKKYEVTGLKPGKYKVYVVANMPETAACANEGALKQVMIDHETKLGQDYKKDGSLNLPMISECGDYTVGISYNEINAPLKFACVKVTYRLLFYEPDNTEGKARPYGSNGFVVTKTRAQNLIKETHLVGNQTESWARIYTGNSFYEADKPAYGTGWTLDKANSFDEGVTPTGTSETTNINFGGRYVAYGTLYLPESEGADNRIKLYFDGKQVAASTTATVGNIPTYDDVDKTYELTLDGEGSADSYRFIRSHHYEVVAEVTDPQVTELSATIVKKEWLPHDMAGDLSHTVLNVTKTKVDITSLKTDLVGFTTNVEPETIKVMDMGSEQLIEGEVDAKLGIIEFSLNSDFSFDQFGDGKKFPMEGDRKVYIQAGNLRKYIDVHYNVSPQFDVTPDEYVFSWDGKELSQEFSFETNLQGVNLAANSTDGKKYLVSGKRYKIDDDGKVVEDNNGPLEISIADGSEGSIKVTMKGSPSDVLTFKLIAEPKDKKYLHLSENLTVVIRPPVTKYRIYFRAINDLQEDGEFADYQNVTNDNNFFFNYDGWCKSDNSLELQYYIYTQMGQTIGGEIPASWVWLFNGKFDAPKNQPTKLTSGANKGWAYLDLDKNEKGYCQEGYGSSSQNDNDYKLPKPGETLIIFNNKNGGTCHRMAFDMEPGIQLFDYEDGEGYYLFDPLCDPYYKVFDSRYKIETVKYRIYSDKQINKWYIDYGSKKSDGSWSNKHWIEKNYSNDEKSKQSKQDKNGNTWYVQDIYAQAPEGLYAKQIKIVFDSDGESIIFDGQNYYSASNPGTAEGIYQDKKWKKGAVEGLRDAKRIWFKPDKWTTPYIYYWKDGNNGPVKWPGEPMIAYGDGWYYIDLGYGLYDRCVINNGSNANQSSDQNISGNNDCYFKETNNSFSTATSKN